MSSLTKTGLYSAAAVAALLGSIAFAAYPQADAQTAEVAPGLATAVAPNVSAASVDWAKLPKGCVAVQEWVDVHRSELPTTLAEFSEYPVPYRKAMYSEFPASVQRSLWLEHLGSFLGSASPLSSEQQAVVREVVQEIDLYLADNDAGEAARADMEARAVALFGEELAFKVFENIGPIDATGAWLTAISKQEPACICEIDEGAGDCEEYGDEYSCYGVDGGCGGNESCDFIWDDTCDGSCFSSPQIE